MPSGLRIIFFLTFFYGAVSSSPNEEATEIYRSIPDDEREAFLQYHLIRKIERDTSVFRPSKDDTRPAQLRDLVDIPQELANEYEMLKMSEDASDVLYDWIKEENSLSDDEMLHLVVRGWVCKPSSSACTSLNNPGNNCCL